jgi:MFS family permease
MAEKSEETESSKHSPKMKTENYRFLNLISYFLFAIGPLVGNAVLVLLGAISADFLVDPTVVLSAIPAFMFPFAIIQLFSGAISDIYGRVQVIIGGLLVFAGDHFHHRKHRHWHWFRFC